MLQWACRYMEVGLFRTTGGCSHIPASGSGRLPTATFGNAGMLTAAFGGGGAFTTEPAFTVAALPLHAQLPEAVPGACTAGRPASCTSANFLGLPTAMGSSAVEHRCGSSSRLSTLRATAGTIADELRLRTFGTSPVDALLDIFGTVGSCATAGATADARCFGISAMGTMGAMSSLWAATGLSGGSLWGGACQSPCGFIGGSLCEDLTRALEQ